MEYVKLNLNENGQGAFFIMEGAEKMGEMVIRISGRRAAETDFEDSERLSRGKAVRKAK